MKCARVRQIIMGRDAVSAGTVGTTSPWRSQMMRGGANLPLVSSYNRGVVLDTIRTRGELSRVELAALTGLTAPTVTNIVRRLIADGYVVEAGQGASTGGKPRTL